MGIFNRRMSLLFRLLLLVMLLETVSACSDTEENKSPNGDYIFRGTIKSDKTSMPIKNIKVSIKNFDGKTLYTNDNGEYNFEYYSVPLTTEWYFKIEDIDSTENGIFENKDTIINLNPSFLHDYDGEWYAGRIESDILIIMKAIR